MLLLLTVIRSYLITTQSPKQSISNQQNAAKLQHLQVCFCAIKCAIGLHVNTARLSPVTLLPPSTQVYN